MHYDILIKGGQIVDGSADARTRRADVGIVGDRVYGFPGGEMMLHASRLLVPRGTKPVIDVTATSGVAITAAPSGRFVK